MTLWKWRQISTHSLSADDNRRIGPRVSTEPKPQRNERPLPFSMTPPSFQGKENLRGLCTHTPSGTGNSRVTMSSCWHFGLLALAIWKVLNHLELQEGQKKKKIMNVNNVNTVIIMWMPGGLGGNLWNSTTRKGFWNLYFSLGWGVGKRVVLNLTVFCHSVPCPDTFAVSFECLSGYRSLLPWHSDSQHHYKGPEAACSLAQEKYPSLFCNCFIWHFWAHVLFSHSQRNEKFLSDVMTLISGASLDSILRL